MTGVALQWRLDAVFSCVLFSKARTGPDAGDGTTPFGGVRGGAPGGGTGLRVSAGVTILNATNHANYAGYSGVMTSPFFGRPTTVATPRRVTIGLKPGEAGRNLDDFRLKIADMNVKSGARDSR